VKRFNEFYNFPVLVSVALFAVNNWWLKYEFHNWFTGKLSDFLFCFFFPLYCSAILSELTKFSKEIRISLGVAFTLIPFVMMKLSTTFSLWISDLFSMLIKPVVDSGSVNVVDITDLIAIPMVLFSVLFMLNKGKVKC
jgi:hypothetical protein